MNTQKRRTVLPRQVPQRSSGGATVLVVWLLTGAMGFGVGRWTAHESPKPSAEPSAVSQSNRAPVQRQYTVPGGRVENIGAQTQQDIQSQEDYLKDRLGHGHFRE